MGVLERSALEAHLHRGSSASRSFFAADAMPMRRARTASGGAELFAPARFCAGLYLRPFRQRVHAAVTRHHFFDVGDEAFAGRGGFGK